MEQATFRIGEREYILSGEAAAIIVAGAYFPFNGHLFMETGDNNKVKVYRIRGGYSNLETEDDDFWHYPCMICGRPRHECT